MPTKPRCFKSLFSRRLMLVVALVVMLLPASVAWAAKSKAEAARERLDLDARQKWSFQFHEKEARVRVMTGFLKIQGAASPEVAATTFLTNYGAALGVKDGHLRNLEKPQREKLDLHDTRLRYQQYFNRVPLYEGELDLFVLGNDTVIQVNSNFKTIESVANQIKIKATRAAGMIAAVLPEEFKATYRAMEQPSLVIYDDGTKFVYAYRVTVSLSMASDLWEYLVDAETGDVLKARPLTIDARFTLEKSKAIPAAAVTDAVKDHGAVATASPVYAVSPKATANAQIFNPNPVASLNNQSLRDNNDSDSAVPITAYQKVTLTDLDPPVNGRYYLNGTYAEVKDKELPANTPISSLTPSFMFTRANDAFEDVMCYYWVTQTQRFLQGLGFTNANNRRLQIDSHGYPGINAFYNPVPIGAGYICMGDGGVDAAEDADVIVHEYGHAVQDNISKGRYTGSGSKGFGNETGAMGEGFSDYMTFTMHVNSVGSGYNPAYLLSWFTKGYDPAALYGRTMNGTKKYPGSMAGEVHDDGEIWSAALYNIYQKLGKVVADRIIIKSTFYVPVNPTFNDGANAILQADATLYASAHAAAITQVFKDRGIFSSVTGPQYLLLPNGGEYFTPGGTMLIKWTANSGLGSRVRLELIKGSSYYMLINSSAANNGAYTWSVPANLAAGGDYKIRVSNSAYVIYSDMSDTAFSIKPLTKVMVYSPAAGAQVKMGQNAAIQWKSELATAGPSVRIELWKDNAKLADLGDDYSSTGENTKYVLMPANLIQGQNYKVRVGSLLNPGFYGESNPFTMVMAVPLEVRSPSAGTFWTTNSDVNIEWASDLSKSGTTVHIELLNNGIKVQDLGFDMSSTGHHVKTWRLPFMAAGANYQVKVTSTMNPSYVVLSSKFNIQIGNMVIVKSPVSGAVWYRNQPAQIEWMTYVPVAGATVKFELWQNGVKKADLGTGYNADGNGISTILVPYNLAPATDYKLRAISTRNISYYTEMNGFITIQ